MKLRSIITCPYCGFKVEETMPTDSCQVLFQCPKCGETLRPKMGNCCVFCSYGSEKCPPMQEKEE